MAGVSRPFSQRKVFITIGTSLTAFLAYSCIYAYRKPFTVATFEGVKFWGISYQTLLILSQVVGYMLSKFVGIKFIAELKNQGRLKATLILVAIAWLCLYLLAVVPAPFGMIFLFVNGFVLGFLWGIVFSYLEGRRATDLMGAVMAVSFIFAGGFTRSVGKWVIIELGVSDTWMPFVTGLIFVAPLLIFLWLLDRVPAPDDDDIRERVRRLPMDGKSRKALLSAFGLGIFATTVCYFFLTIMRDVRDNYMANIWSELGHGNDYSVFTRVESRTSLAVLAIMAMLVLIRQNSRALMIIHVVIAAGLAIAGISSYMFVEGQIDGLAWMQWVSLGLYMGYIPFNCIFFERMIATFRVNGNYGFLMYFVDSFGYLGSVAIMLSKELVDVEWQWSEFYSQGVLIGAVIGVVAIVFSYVYFQRKVTRLKFDA